MENKVAFFQAKRIALQRINNHNGSFLGKEVASIEQEENSLHGESNHKTAITKKEVVVFPEEEFLSGDFVNCKLSII
ncbi:MAG: hypothetical protein IJ720_04325 [Clostridia bacterium]|nr:hypothetical protein [Clostridia bacterium]